MTVTYACPGCHAAVRTPLEAASRSLACPGCGMAIAIAAGAVGEGRVERCLVCPSTDLFVRKDFPQRIGVMLVAVGIVGSSVAWYYANLPWTFGILFASALADVLLYALVGEALMCYRCGAMYRGAAHLDEHGQFNLETHEKHRQMVARLGAAAIES